MSSKLYFVLNCDKLQHCGDDTIIADIVHSLVLLVYRINDYVYYMPANSPGFSSNPPTMPPPPRQFSAPKSQNIHESKLKRTIHLTEIETIMSLQLGETFSGFKIQ